MKRIQQPENIEKLITQDNFFVFTIVSLLMVAIIYLNQVSTNSLIMGTIASLIFFSINTIFLEQALFEEENALTRFVLGSLMLLLLLGIISWVTLITYNLNIINTSIALCALTILCSSVNRLRKKASRRKHK